jgi:hypothetical protein
MERPPRIEKDRTFNAGRRNPNQKPRRKTTQSWERQESGSEDDRGTEAQQTRRGLRKAPSKNLIDLERPESLPFLRKLEILVTCMSVFAPPIAAFVFIVTRYKVPDATNQLILGSLFFGYIATVLRLMYPAEIGSSLLKAGSSLLKVAGHLGTHRTKSR